MWSEDKARIAAAHGKSDCLSALKRGELGNTMPSWSGHEWRRLWRRDRRRHECAMGWPKTYGVRIAHPDVPYKERWSPDIPGCRLWRNTEAWRTMGILDFVTIWQMAPTDRTLLNAEAMRSERHLDLHYSRKPVPLRESLACEAAACWEHGLSAEMILRWALDAPSYDNLMSLLDRFPDHVVELSAYSVGCGTLGWNTCFWEVRTW